MMEKIFLGSNLVLCIFLIINLIFFTILCLVQNKVIWGKRLLYSVAIGGVVWSLVSVTSFLFIISQ